MNRLNSKPSKSILAIQRVYQVVIRMALVLLVPAMLNACAGNAPVTTAPSDKAEVQNRAKTNELNRKLTNLAQQSAPVSAEELTDYDVGSGDILEISVFQVEELNRSIRVNARGGIILPLLGEVHVGGLSIAEVEELLAARLGDKYLQNPQVSVFVTEFRSQQITVMGNVNAPAVHNVNRPHSLLEVLSMSGGLNSEASDHVYVQTTMRGEGGKAPTKQSLVIDLKEIVQAGDTSGNVVLRGGDSVYVPESGVVFVEGYVNNPGAYRIQSGTNSLKAIAMAGGAESYADEKNIRILRSTSDGQEVISVDIKAIRENQAEDVPLQDGDVVVVQAHAIKKPWIVFWRELRGIVSLQRPL